MQESVLGKSARAQSLKKGAIVKFTATPAIGYKVDTWMIVGSTIVEGGADGCTTAKVKITADTRVSVSFKSETVTPEPETFTVTFGVKGEDGTLKAEADDKPLTSGKKVAKGTTVIFTATADAGYLVDKWTVTGGAFVKDTSTDGSMTAKVKIAAATKVSVSFKNLFKVSSVK